jgi:hypothetical protein
LAPLEDRSAILPRGESNGFCSPVLLETALVDGLAEIPVILQWLSYETERSFFFSPGEVKDDFLRNLNILKICGPGIQLRVERSWERLFEPKGTTVHNRLDSMQLSWNLGD